MMKNKAESTIQKLIAKINDVGVRDFVASSLACVVVILIYIWFISAGTWRNWPRTSNYYSLLAESFQNGQLSLQEKPDPALLALPNPYDPKARKAVPFISDASLYEGKYYFYWGPVPSLIIAAITSFISIDIGDQFVVFAFACGTLFFEAILIISLWKKFFPTQPQWMIVLAILLAGLTSPFTRMLVHPLIYEASIAGGQFFIIGGFYFMYTGLERKRANSWKLGMAGIFLTCAIGTRVLQVFPVAFMVLITLTLLFILNKPSGTLSKLAMPVGALLLPLGLGAIGLAWYNWARFGSVFEFGYYYQLAGFNLQSFYHNLFSRVYVLQNLYNYIFNPFQVSNHFPFIEPVSGSESAVFASYDLPKAYVVEGKITGFLYSCPFVIFGLIPVVGLFVYLFRKFIAKSKGEVVEEQSIHTWIDLSLTICSISAFIPTMMFFFAATRYMGDFFPFLSILGIIGYWESYRLVNNQSKSRKLIAVLGFSLAVYSILITTILAFTTRLSWFNSYNPGLMSGLKRLLGG